MVFFILQSLHFFNLCIQQYFLCFDIIKIAFINSQLRGKLKSIILWPQTPPRRIRLNWGEIARDPSEDKTQSLFSCSERIFSVHIIQCWFVCYIWYNNNKKFNPHKIFLERSKTFSMIFADFKNWITLN